MNAWGTVERRSRGRSIVMGTCKGPVAQFPLKAGDTLVVDAVLLIMAFVETSKAECFLGFQIMKREVM